MNRLLYREIKIGQWLEEKGNLVIIHERWATVPTWFKRMLDRLVWGAA